MTSFASIKFNLKADAFSEDLIGLKLPRDRRWCRMPHRAGDGAPSADKLHEVSAHNLANA